jgi:hypothetical protein
LRETANLHAWLRLMRDGTPLDPHPIQMLPLLAQTAGRLRRVVARTRTRHMTPRAAIDAKIDAFFADVAVRKPKTKKHFRRADG